MATPSDRAETIGQALQAVCPELKRVALPRAGLFSTPVHAPDLYPDDHDTHGYFVPVPPPPPFKGVEQGNPTFVGEHGGRQWTVEVMVTGVPGTRYDLGLSARTYGRFTGSEDPPFRVLPWTVAAFPRRPDQRPGVRGRTPLSPYEFNFAGEVGRRALRNAELFLGRPPVASQRPPGLGPVVLEAWDAQVRGWLDSDRFLGLFAGWERRSIPGDAGWSPSAPVFTVLTDQVRFDSGISSHLAPEEHAATVREVLDLVPKLEREMSGRDATTDPISTTDLLGPPGSVPDRRPVYRCPQCGAPEILKRRFDPPTGLVHRQTLRCGADIFPPYPGRAAGPTVGG